MIKHILSLLIILIASSALASDQVNEEIRYNQFLDAIQTNDSKSLVILDPKDGKIFVDALWDSQENGIVPMRLRAVLNRLPTQNLELIDLMRVEILRDRVGMNFSRRELGTALMMGLADKRDGSNLALSIVSLRKDLNHMGLAHIVNNAKIVQPVAAKLALSSEEPLVGGQGAIAKDLWIHELDLQTWSRGKYASGIRIYTFCRTNRDFPCLQVIRDRNHEAVRLEDGTLWSQPALAKSGRNLPSNQRNGHTPAGIHTIDSVMPYADQVPSFGKFRRLILDFIPKSKDEMNQKAILPASSVESNWWKPNVVARDVGRNLFRIHGTGRLNEDEQSTWHPFRPTSGCIAKRENTYDDIEYRDQRNLLDVLMDSMGLAATYENETEIKGLLFLIEIDDKEAPVLLEDLKAIGIE